MRAVAASIILLLLGTWAAWAITGGFEVLTTEQARRIEIARKQPAVPKVHLIDQAGRAFRFDEWVRKQNKFVIVDFIYTNCHSLCRVLGTEFQQIQRSVIERGLQGRVHLLSLSFDPAHDTWANLERYARQIQAEPDAWTFATVDDANDLGGLLGTFGVTVIPDSQGGFQHNAALVWIEPSGKLIRVMDFDANGYLRFLDELAKSNWRER